MGVGVGGGGGVGVGWWWGVRVGVMWPYELRSLILLGGHIGRCIGVRGTFTKYVITSVR